VRRWRDLAGYVGIRATVGLVTVAVLFRVALRAWRGQTHQHSEVYVSLMLVLLGVAVLAWILDDGLNRWLALQFCAWGSWVVLITLALLDVDRGQYPIILSLLAGGGAILGTTVGKRWMIVYLTLTVLALVLAAVSTDQYDGATIAAIVCIGAGVGAWVLGDKFNALDHDVSEVRKTANQALEGARRAVNESRQCVGGSRD